MARYEDLPIGTITREAEADFIIVQKLPLVVICENMTNPGPLVERDGQEEVSWYQLPTKKKLRIKS